MRKMEGKEDTQIIQEAPAAIEEKDERGKKNNKVSSRAGTAPRCS